MPDDTSGSQPSEQRIREELQAAKDLWTDTMADKVLLQEMYRRTYPVKYLKAENTLITPVEFRSGDYDENIDRVVGLINIAPRYSITAKGLGPRPKEHGEKVEDWDNNILDEIEFYQGQRFSNDVCYEVANFGITAESVLPDPSAWEKYPRYDSGDPKHYNKLVAEFGPLAPPPIRITHIPLLTWRPLLSGRIVLKSFQVQEVRAADIRYRYPDLKLPDRDTLKDTDKLEYVTYIDDTWCVYLVLQGGGGGSRYTMTEVAKAWRHHMNFDGSLTGRAPVVLYEGITTGDTDLRYRWKGYGESIADTVKAQDMVISSQVTRSLLAGSPTMDLVIDPAVTPEQFNKLNTNLEYKIGGANVTVPGARWEEHKFGDMPMVQEFVWKKLEGIKDSRFPPSLKGQIDAGTAGYLFNLATEYAMTILKPGAHNIARSDVHTMRLIHLALGALEDMAGGPVTVYVRKRSDKGTEAVGLNYDDVRDYGGLLDAVRESELPVDEQANLDAIDKAIRVGLPRRDSYQRYGRRENPQELMDQAMGEAIENEPAFLAMRRQAILRRMGILRDQKEGVVPEDLMGMAALPPALQQLLAAMQAAQGPPAEGPVGPMEGGMVGPTVPPGGNGQMAGLPQAVTPPVMAPTPPPTSIPMGPAPPRVNPRAGKRTQPGGPRRRTGSVQQGGRS